MRNFGQFVAIVIGLLLLLIIGGWALRFVFFIVGMAFKLALGVIVVIGLIAAWAILQKLWRS